MGYSSYEKDGVDYHFAKRDSMEQWIRQGRFLEYGEYKGNLYGTLADSVHAVIKQGTMLVMKGFIFMGSGKTLKETLPLCYYIIHLQVVYLY